MVDEALKHRNTKMEEEDKGEFLLIEDKMFQDIQNIDFLSSKFLCSLNFDRETWSRSVLASEEDC